MAEVQQYRNTEGKGFQYIGEAPPPFDYLDANVYVNRKKKKAGSGMECMCIPKPGQPCCGEDCLNRMMMMECNPKSCPCPEQCANMNFQRCKYANVTVFKTEWKGWGLQTLTDLPAGTFLLEYTGEVVNYAGTPCARVHVGEGGHVLSGACICVCVRADA